MISVQFVQLCGWMLRRLDTDRLALRLRWEWIGICENSKEEVNMMYKSYVYDITGRLVVGETYTFTEFSTPSGYQLAKQILLKIKDTGKAKIMTVKDAPLLEVSDTPQTGGNMLLIPITAGLLMVVGAAVMI